MNRRLLAVFVFALVVAGLASFAVYRILISQVRINPNAAAPVAANKLTVAAHDLQVGAMIHDADLVEASWSGSMPPQALKRQDALGRGVVASIYAGEPILEKRLAAQGAGAGLASTIPVGMRAVALRVNEIVGVAGFVLPGMHVDVLINGNAPVPSSAQTGVLCRTVLQDIEVLSAGQKIEKNVEGKPELVQVVNLLVSPDQAEVMSLASDQTRVQLVLRNPLDANEKPTNGTSLASLFGQAVKAETAARAPVRPAAPRMAPPDSTTIEIYNGAKRTEQRIGNAER